MRFLFILFLSLLTACSTLAEPNHSDATLRYNSLVSELKNSIQLDKIIEAREVYPTTDLAPQLSSETRLIPLIKGAIEESDWAICLAYSNELLAIHYSHLFAHYGAMVCHYELKQAEQSHYHQQMLNTILEAFWQTGDGEQPDSAFFAISEQDVKAFIEFHGLELKSMTRLSTPQAALIQAQLYDLEKDEQFDWFFRLAKTD